MNYYEKMDRSLGESIYDNGRVIWSLGFWDICIMPFLRLSREKRFLKIKMKKNGSTILFPPTFTSLSTSFLFSMEKFS